MKGVRRAYWRAAVEKRAKQQLRDALSRLEKQCLRPQQASAGTDDLHRAMMQMTRWPSRDVLDGLDSSVRKLSLFDREEVPKPLWKAFELVNQRWPGFGLIRRLNALVSRARKLLEEAGESDLTSVRREANGSGKRASEAKRFLADLRKFQKDSKEAAKIKWQDYDYFLFQPGGNKRIQLACGGDPAASPRVKCYCRALEIIADDQRREPLHEKAEPLLLWVAYVGNPADSDVLKWDDFIRLLAERNARQPVEERAEHTRTQARMRQRRLRAKKRFHAAKA